ncbi:hypothetical protein AQUCO_03400061v1 [Aquilegia coerulea]|uniref:Pentacotripeptide-repeat region of PRORP domain-containing protein n=1 Tax=Aquilegia coerulea TaxID=218851 RepID=A0A2G5CYB3_AQUCA|nr:hypothetical protein AQUCO_03400061v1 [Aquilegia coerulea]
MASLCPKLTTFYSNQIGNIFSPKSFSSKAYQEHLLSLLLKNPTRNTALQIHSHLLTTGFNQSCFSTKTEILIFNTLLRVYSQDVFPEEAFKLYKHVLGISTSSFVFSNTFTYSFLLKACTNLNQPIKGFQVHGIVIKVGFELHLYVQTQLVNMYSFCGFLVEGMKVFDEMPERNSVTWNSLITGLTKWGELDRAKWYFERMSDRNVVSWTVLIDGYTRGNQYAEALRLFCRMMSIGGVKPTDVTILTVLPAVYNFGDISICQSIHAYGEKTGFNASDIRVTNSLIDAYAKCGCMKNAYKVFQEIPTKRKNLVSWTSVISGFAMHGMAKEALELFEEMEEETLRANQITFLSVLNACSHGGLVKEGVGFFKKMVDEYQIPPNIKHYGCMIDMLGRAGMLEEAEKIALDIPSEMVNVVVWRILLGACSFHENVEMGERVLRKILKIERGYAGDYVLLSNILTGVGRFGEAEEIRTLMDEWNALKVPGLSLVDGRATR